jgi:DNA sulfur modification protein DndD
MILHRLEMVNFRQFRGKQVIEFARNDTTPGKTVTVVFGENGRGKTSIFRALIYALFGERHIAQDDGIPDGELQLVNVQALRENASHGGAPVEAQVTVSFAHGDEEYKLTRSLCALLDENGVVREEEVDVQLACTRGGNTETLKTIDKDEIEKRVSAVLAPGVRDYFLFDGERIARLTRASRSQRREVRKGIRNLLDIDALEEAIGALKKVARSIAKDIAGKATGELARVHKKIMDTEQDIDDARRRMSELADEREKADAEKEDVERKLRQFEEIKDLLERRSELETTKKDLKERTEGLAVQTRGACKKGALILADPVIEDVFSYIDGRRKRGELPPDIRADLIEKILAEGKCFCGACVAPDSEAYYRILEWKAKAEAPDTSDDALELWRHLGTARTSARTAKADVQTHLTACATVRHDQMVNDDARASVDEQIGSRGAGGDVKKLEEHRERIARSIVDFAAERQLLVQKTRDLTTELQTLHAERKQLESKQNIQNDLRQRRNLAEAAHGLLGDLHDSFTRETRKHLSESATGILKRLLDEQGQRSLASVAIDEDYALQILDLHGKPFLANISAGQRQLVSIALITALAQAAGDGNLLDVPLFMDTPFGRLSYEHRKSLIREIPRLCAQWVLLATDTELRKEEGQLLLSGGAWGRFYSLRGQPDGCSKIKELTPRQSLTILSQAELEHQS